MYSERDPPPFERYRKRRRTAAATATATATASATAIATATATPPSSTSSCTSFSDHVLLRTLEGYVDAGYISDVAVLHPAGDASSVAEEPSISDPTKDEALVDEPSFCFATSACIAKAF